MATKRKTTIRTKPAKRRKRKPALPAQPRVTTRNFISGLIDPAAEALQRAADTINKTADQLAVDHARRQNQKAVDHAKRKIDRLTGGPVLP